MADSVKNSLRTGWISDGKQSKDYQSDQTLRHPQILNIIRQKQSDRLVLEAVKASLEAIKEPLEATQSQPKALLDRLRSRLNEIQRQLDKTFTVVPAIVCPAPVDTALPTLMKSQKVSSSESTMLQFLGVQEKLDEPDKIVGVQEKLDEPDKIIIDKVIYVPIRGAEPPPKSYWAPPTWMNLRGYCPETIDDQGNNGSCSAHAGIGLLEFFYKKSFNKDLHLSRRFLHTVARELRAKDTSRSDFPRNQNPARVSRANEPGVALRYVMKAMTIFGVPPEDTWPYDVPDEEFETDPTAFCYAFAQSYQAIQYFRLDKALAFCECSKSDDCEQLSAGQRSALENTLVELRKTLLVQVKALLAAGFPAMFGFWVYGDSLEADSKETGEIPYHPKPEDGRLEQGHAVLAVGYDDDKQISGAPSKGAIFIRNSWGDDWGTEETKGYGWLPYDYVLNGLTADWWSLIEAEWLDEGEFGLKSGEDKFTVVSAPPKKPPH